MKSLCLLLICGVCGLQSAEAASSAPVGAEQGMVVTAQHEATRVGVEVLRRGGNAVDAAVAVGYALAVVYPAAGNLGGGGFMTLRMADGRQRFLDFREVAPLAATRDMYLGPDGKPQASKSWHGHLAVGVPGTVRGLELARERFGSLPRRQLLAPAIRLAEQGFVLDAGDLALLHLDTAEFRKDPPTAAVLLRHGQPWQIGERLVQRDLAKTLRQISEHGAEGFYTGPVAAALAKSSRSGGGLITVEDLARYRVRELEPLRCHYRGYDLLSAPPPSSGGVVLCQMLRVLEAYPLRDWGYRSARAVHVQIEAMRHAFADRNQYLGDPDFVKLPLERLTSEVHAQRIRAGIDAERATDSRTLGHPGLRRDGSGNTTHYSVVDRWGNAVAVTYTLNDWFGAKVMAAGTGVLLNNEMDDFTIQPGVPNAAGLVQGEANAIAPGKRPLSSMTPTLLLKNGQLVGVLGTPGGPRIITALLLTLLNLVDYGMTLQEAVDAPRFHHQWLPDETVMERFAISPDTQRLLEAMGHRFGPPPSANHLAAILVGAPALEGKPQGRLRYWGANDPRRGTGLAAGY